LNELERNLHDALAVARTIMREVSAVHHTQHTITRAHTRTHSRVWWQAAAQRRCPRQ
jgi:hypothetical protein